MADMWERHTGPTRFIVYGPNNPCPPDVEPDHVIRAPRVGGERVEINTNRDENK